MRVLGFNQIKILAEKMGKATENIKMLDRFGLSPAEIAEILNTTTNHVNVTKSIMKKNKKLTAK